MSPNGVNLTEYGGFETWIQKHLAYVTDPPPFVIKFFDEKMIKEIYRIKYDTLAKVAELQSQIIHAEVDMYKQISKLMGR